MMDELDELRTMARNPQHYSNYTMAIALHQLLDQLTASQAREAGLREALMQYGTHQGSCPLRYNMSMHGCRCGLWELQYGSAAPPREGEAE